MKYNIYDFIDKVMVQPAFYVGYSTLLAIQTLINGFSIAMSDMDVVDVGKPSFQNFSRWLGYKYGVKSEVGSYPNLILSRVLDNEPADIKIRDYNIIATYEQHAEAIELFKDLLMEYKSLSQEEVDFAVEQFWKL